MKPKDEAEICGAQSPDGKVCVRPRATCYGRQRYADQIPFHEAADGSTWIAPMEHKGLRGDEPLEIDPDGVLAETLCNACEAVHELLHYLYIDRGRLYLEARNADHIELSEDLWRALRDIKLRLKETCAGADRGELYAALDQLLAKDRFRDDVDYGAVVSRVVSAWRAVREAGA